MTNTEKNQIAQMIAESIFQTINVYGEILRLIDQADKKDEKHSSK